MLIVFIRSIILYVVIVFSIRLMGKHQLGELSPNELVITILISNIATLPAENSEIPLIRGIVPVLTLVCLDVIVSTLAFKSRKIRRLVSGSPKVIISDGKVIQKELKNIRYTTDDLMESMRNQGIFDISEVQYAIVETNGKLSFYLKAPFQPLTPESQKHTIPTSNPPVTIIDDGEIITSSMDSINMTQKQLDLYLSRNNIAPKEVYLFSTDGKNKNILIRKEPT
ncbi:MAG: DUF421 domain-containing protein [Ruminococcus sp.]|nr:DUF421 domain-containing protein [Ruminococcus sp.]